MTTMRYSRMLVCLLAISVVGLNAQSLGEMARMIRAQKASAPKARPARVYTNENLPRDTSISIVGQNPAPAAGAAAGGTAPATPGAAPAAAKGEAPKEDEKVWRAKFAQLNAKQKEEERRLDLLQRELNMAQIQAYSDPNKANQEAFTRNEVTKRAAEIDAQKQVVEQAKKAVADLTDELRRKGLPSGWAQP